MPIQRCLWKCAVVFGLAAVSLLATRSLDEQDHPAQEFPGVPLPTKTGPLSKALMLLREGKTVEARKDLEEQRKSRPSDPDVLYQIARSYLMDFYQLEDAGQRRIAL